jgi:hypothetical protein
MYTIMASINTDIQNWSVEDLVDLFGVSQTATESEIDKSAGILISKASASGNNELVTFLKKAVRVVKEHVLSLADEWTQNQYLTQSNKTQSEKVTNRVNQIQIFDGENGHYQMKRNRLGVNQTYQVPVVQGTINPTQQNILKKTVIIDSQYRPNLFPYTGTDLNAASFTSDFTVTLSETLNDVVSMELYSVQIPRTWYNIDNFRGNNCLMVSHTTTSTLVGVEPGNYDVNTLKTAVTTALAGVPPVTVSLEYDASKSRYYFKNSSLMDAIITFYMPTGWSATVISGASCAASCTTLGFPNNSLGWTLGFRTSPDVDNVIKITVSSGGGKTYAEAAPSLYGPQYALLVVDDFNKNRQTKNVVGVADRTTKLAIPQYADPANLDCDANNNPVFLKTAPRRLTQAQLFTINSIVEDRERRRYRSPAPTTNDVLAMIPLTGETEMIVRYGTDLAINKRVYFGPVDIERLHIQLLDDKGNPFNLNGVDWSFSFNVEYLYQY